MTEEAHHQIMEDFNNTWPQNQEKYEESEKLKMDIKENLTPLKVPLEMSRGSSRTAKAFCGFKQ